MRFIELLKRNGQWIIGGLVILFFLNLVIKLPFMPKELHSARPLAGTHSLRDFLIITIAASLITILLNRIKNGGITRLILPLRRVKGRYFLVAIFILYFIVNCLVAYFIFEASPIFMDSLSYINQAKIFGAGSLYAPAPFSPSHFASPTDAIIGGKWYSRYPPGFSLMLALGVISKIPLWIINPFIASCSLIIIYILGKKLYGKRIGIYVCLLAFFSPFLLFCNGTFESEPLALLFILLFILFFSSTVKKEGILYPVLSGLSLGAAFITRPYSALFASLPFIIYLGYLCLKRQNKALWKACLFICSFAAFFLFFLWYNWQLTGNPFVLTYNAPDRFAILKYDYPGFHIAPCVGRMYASGNPYVFGPIDAVLNVNRNLIFLNRDLFGWPVSFLFIFVPFLFVRKNKWDVLLIFLFFSILLGYSFYWQSNTKYWHASLPALLLLTARGITKAPLLLRKIGIPRRAGCRFILIFISACFLYSILCWQPYFWKSRKALICQGRKRMLIAVKGAGIHNAIIFIRPAYMPAIYQPLLNEENARQSAFLPIMHPIYLTGLSQNSPGLRDDVLYALDLGEKNTGLIKHYSGRRYFIYEYNPKNTDKLYEIYNQSPE